MFKEYKKYKEDILGAIMQNKVLTLESRFDKSISLLYTEKNYTGIRREDLKTYATSYIDEDYGKSTMEAKNPSYLLGAMQGIRDENDKLYGKELLTHLFDTHRICCGVVSKENIDKLPYDINGTKTLIQDGVLVQGIEYMLNGFNNSYRYQADTGIFCLKDIDEDGVVVLPPGCSALLLLNSSEVTKLKKIIMVVSDTLEPAVFGIGQCKYVADISYERIETLDLSNVVFESYNSQIRCHISCFDSNRGDEILLKPNGEYAFNFKKVIYNVYNNMNKDKTNLHVMNVLPFVNVEINVMADTQQTKVSCYQVNTNTTINVIKKTSTDNSLIIDICDDSVRYSDIWELHWTGIDRIIINDKCQNKDIIGRLHKLYENIQPGTQLIVSPYRLNYGKVGDIKFREYIDEFNALIQRGVEVKAWLLGPNCSYLEEDVLKDKDIYDYSYLKDMMALYFIQYIYGNLILTKEALGAIDKENIILNYMDKTFGSCNSTYGILRYEDARDKFCTNEYLDIKEYDITSDLFLCELGAGVGASFTMYQLWLLRISGLKCHYFLNFNKNNIYNAEYAEENSTSRNQIQGYEALILSSKLGNTIKEGQDIWDFYGCVFRNEWPKRCFVDIFSGQEGGHNKLLITHEKTRIVQNHSYKNYNSLARKTDMVGNDYKLSSVETTKKNIVDMVDKVKVSKYKERTLSGILEFVKTSMECGLYGGVEIKGLSVEVYANIKLPKNVVIDDLKYQYVYTLYKIERQDTGEVVFVEEKTLLNLLQKGKVVSSNFNYSLIPNSIIFLRDEYDKEVTDMIQQMSDAQLLFSQDKPISSMKFEPYGGNYSCTFYNMGEELLLPSFVIYAVELVEEKERVEQLADWTEVKRVGIEVNNTEPIDVTDRMDSLLEDKNSTEKKDTRYVGTNSVARKPGIEFYCSEQSYYKSKNKKPLTIYSVIANKLLELPQGMGIDFCYTYISNDFLYKKEVPITKIVVRKDSEIYRITSATHVDIADNCLIHKHAFLKSRIQEVVIHGGTIPEKCFEEALEFKKLIVDGGKVNIHVTAFLNCPSFSGIECINGGFYTLLDSDNAIVMNDLKNDLNNRGDMIEFYKDLFDEMEHRDSVAAQIEVIDVIPYSINSDFTVTLKHRDGKETSLTTSRIAKMLDSGCLNFKHTTKNGKELDFITTLTFSKLRCLSFIPGINNNFCSQEVCLVLDTDRLSVLDMMEEVRFVFGYQFNDWYTGKIKELPLKYLNEEYKGGLFFDIYEYSKSTLNTVTEVDNVGLCCHFWQNIYYYSDNAWSSFKRYYNGNSGYRPEERGYYSTAHFDSLYFPASHEYSIKYKKQDASTKGKVIFGELNKYGKWMHNKRYTAPLAYNVYLIPGIGESCMLEVRSLYASDNYDEDHLLWAHCRNMYISTPTRFMTNACTRYFNYDNVQHLIHHIFSEVEITAPVYMKFGAFVTKHMFVRNTNLVIDGDATFIASGLFEGVQDFYIDFIGDCKFRVINLKESSLDILYNKGCIKFALQLLLNSDEYSELENTTIGHKLLNMNIKDKTCLETKYYTKEDIDVLVSVPKQEKTKVEGDSVFEEDTEDEPDSIESMVEGSLELGIIPSVITMDYIEETPVENIGLEVFNIFSDLDTKDEQEDFSNIDTNNAKSAKMLVELCGVDVKKLQDEYDKQQVIEEEEAQELLEVQHEKEREDALRQKEELFRILDEQDKQESMTLEQVYHDNSREQVRDKLYKEYEQQRVDKVVDNENKTNDIIDIKPAIDENMFDVKIQGQITKGLGDALKTGLADSTKIAERVKLIVIDEILKSDKVVGYILKNEKTEEVKRLPIDSVKKLCLNLRYKVIGVQYDIHSNELVRVL